MWETSQKIRNWRRTETTEEALTAIIKLKIFIVFNHMAIILNPVIKNSKQ